MSICHGRARQGLPPVSSSSARTRYSSTATPERTGARADQRQAALPVLERLAAADDDRVAPDHHGVAPLGAGQRRGHHVLRDRVVAVGELPTSGCRGRFRPTRRGGLTIGDRQTRGTSASRWRRQTGVWSTRGPCAGVCRGRADVPGQLADDPVLTAPPLHRCPSCRAWAPRATWVGDGAAGAIDFTMRCPCCGRCSRCRRRPPTENLRRTNTAPAVCGVGSPALRVRGHRSKLDIGAAEDERRAQSLARAPASAWWMPTRGR